MRKILICVITVFLIAFHVNVFAVPITFTHIGTGSGSLDGVPFGEVEFTITAYGDTDNRESSTALYIVHDTAYIELGSLGTFQFTSLTRTFVDQADGTVGFSRGEPDEDGFMWDLFDGPWMEEELKTWGMLSEIGPISDNDGWLDQWTGGSYSPIFTNGGQLIFDRNTGFEATFRAEFTSVPDASIMLLLGSSLMGLVVFRRKSKKS